MDEDRIPVIASSGQVLERDELVSAIELARRAAGLAFDGSPGLRSAIDQLSLVNILGKAPRNGATMLARSLGLSPSRCEYTTIGGNTPQWLVTRAASAIERGELRGALIVGAEAMRSQKAGGAPYGRGFPHAETSGEDGSKETEGDLVVGDDRPGLSASESAIGLVLPAHIYPMFESVMARTAGRSYAEQRATIGRLMAPFTEVAAGNAQAWFPTKRSAEEIATPGPDNRIVAEPYTKLMSAFLGSDQAAAIVVTSLAAARAAGVADSAIFICSGADASDVWFPSARPDPGVSPGIRAAGTHALEAAGIGLDDVSLIDFYSCFPSAVEMAIEALGLSEDDSRGFTVTGGLPYFGGPGNNYTTHAIATMASELHQSRAASGGTGGTAFGLVSGLGWYATKHSYGVYATTPPPGGFKVGDTSSDQAAIDATEVPVRSGESVDGDLLRSAVVVAGTVVYDRNGDPVSAPVFARLADGSHVVAKAHGEEMAHLAGADLVGREIAIEGQPYSYHVLSEGGS